MSVFLPEELVLEILYRLPIKSLVQCTCVCKSWNSLIKSPTFISSHLSNHSSSAKENPIFLLRLCSSSDNGSRFFEEDYSLHFDDEHFTQFKQLHSPPFEKYHSCYHIVGSCNGLICLADDLLYDFNKFILWNPSIRKFLVLPEPSHDFRTCSSAFKATVQFGYDPRTDDYKIVRMKSVLAGCHPEIEIFSLNRGSWKEVSEIGSTHSGDVAGSFPAFVNNTLHWLAYKKRECAAGHHNVVLGFDASDEALSELTLPESLADAALGMLSIMAYRESSIAVVHYDTHSYAKSQHKCHVWVMKKYGDASSWMKLFSCGIQGEDLPRIMGFRKNGDILAEMDGDLVSVDPNNNGFRVKHLGIQIKKGLDSLLFDPTASYGDGDYATPPLYSPPIADIAFLDTHVESLVLLDKGKNEGDDINDFKC